MAMAAERLGDLILTEPEIAKLTPEALEKALDGFPLPLPDLTWLARAVQGALYASRVPPDQATDRQGNDKTQDELNDCAAKLGDAWLALMNLSGPADAAIWDYAGREGGFGEPPEHRQFTEICGQLEWTRVFLRRAAMRLDVQRPKWRQRARKDERIFQAQCLGEVYRMAFDREPSAHSWPSKTKPWPDFYERVIAATYGMRGTNDIPSILDEAHALDKEGRVTFGAGIIPDKPL